jgi:hypothetical protein
MTATIDPELYGDLVQVASRPGFADWQAMVRSIGGCAEPVQLWGQCRTVYTGTGEVLSQREPGRLLVACGNRRQARCPSCSETYRADTFQLIKAGLVGGKSVPDSVAEHPKVFATFTAPSFGPVHHRIIGTDGKVRRCHPRASVRCRRRHRPDNPELGQPLDPDSYNYVAAVIWNALSTRLWARTVQLVSRQVARLLDVPQRAWPEVGRVSVAKVAEYQARGVVHFHAIFRIDGPEQGDSSPAGATSDLLCEAIRQAAAVVKVLPPEHDALEELASVVWGDQLDLRCVSNEIIDGRTLTDSQVAGYLAKYATKGAEASGTADRPLVCRGCQGSGRQTDSTKSYVCKTCGGDGSRYSVDELGLGAHAQAMIATCWKLGGLAGLEHLRLRPWAHMLGFRGPFSTKTRRYSTTLDCLRKARKNWRMAHTLTAHGLDPTTRVIKLLVEDLGDLDGADEDEDAVLVIGQWRYAGRGHTSGEAIYAQTIAHDLAENRRSYRQIRHREERMGA